MTERFDWDALAPYWHLFEAGGSDATVIDAVLRDDIHGPLLYVGAGLGTYAAALAGLVGEVVAIDRSAAMARRAREHHAGLPLVIGDLTALPFRDAAFRGVLCATGVMEFLGEALPAAYRELARVARGAPIHVAAFVGDATVFDRHAAARAWLAGARSDAQLDALAAELGDRERAARLVEQAMPALAGMLRERTIIDAAASASLPTRRLLHDRQRGIMLWRHA
jgi:hypothetical protein